MEDQTKYIDLGLPSGTLWAEGNASFDGMDLLTFGEASFRFGRLLPSWNDYAELIARCRHRYDTARGGSVFTGPNGNELFFPCGSMKCYVPESENQRPGYIHLDGYSRYWSCSAPRDRKNLLMCLLVQDTLSACGFPYHELNRYNVRLCRRRTP